MTHLPLMGCIRATYEYKYSLLIKIKFPLTFYGMNKTFLWVDLSDFNQLLLWRYCNDKKAYRILVALPFKMSAPSLPWSLAPTPWAMGFYFKFCAIYWKILSHKISNCGEATCIRVPQWRCYGDRDAIGGLDSREIRHCGTGSHPGKFAPRRSSELSSEILSSSDCWVIGYGNRICHTGRKWGEGHADMITGSWTREGVLWLGRAIWLWAVGAAVLRDRSLDRTCREPVARAAPASARTAHWWPVLGKHC